MPHRNPFPGEKIHPGPYRMGKGVEEPTTTGSVIRIYRGLGLLGPAPGQRREFSSWRDGSLDRNRCLSAGQQEGRPNYATEWTNFTW